MNEDRLLRDLRQSLRDGGLFGSVLVRDLHTGAELGIEPDEEMPVASLVKVPLAIATLVRVRRGELDGSTPVDVEPGQVRSPGPIGVTRFLHPARIAIDDLVYLSTCISDGSAADALFELTPPERVTEILRDHGVGGITVRHTMRDLVDTPVSSLDADQTHLGLAIAIDAGTSGRGHRVPQLDVSVANSGTARAFVDLLQALWVPSEIPEEVASRVRSLLANNVLRHRLAPDFDSDSSRWSSKTGTLLNLRHEVGVVEHANGQAFAIAVLTESRVAASSQFGAEALMARVARTLRDRLR